MFARPVVTHSGRKIIRPSNRNLGWFSGLLVTAQSIIRGDDFDNPKKLLERKYLYFALIALQYRNMRLAAPDTVEMSDLYEQATKELIEKDPDGTPNAELRRELQTMLEPQVRSIFQTFEKVDRELGLPRDENLEDLTEIFKSVLDDEYELSSKSDGNAFFDSKRQAIETLFRFHGWSLHGGDSFDDDGLDPFGMDVSKTSESTLSLIRYHQTLNLCRSAMVRKTLGYSVLCLRSTIPGAGRGLFLDGSALGGSLVAFQPGDIWPKEHMVTRAPDVMAHFEDDSDIHISIRFDDIVVDARQSPVTVLSKEGSMNPMALGHMANHPSAGMEPNIQSTMLDFTGKMKLKHLMKYVPNQYARDPSWQGKIFLLEEILMNGLCLIAKRDVENEELVYDYRLQSDDVPEWYESIQNPDDDGLDNERIVFLREDWKQKKDE